MHKTRPGKGKRVQSPGTKLAGRNGLSRLQERYAQAEAKGDLNQTRRSLLRAVLDNPAETYFLSSRELAKRFDIDTATVVRTVQALGYEKFADFAADLREHFVLRITPYRVMKTAAEEGRSPADHVAASLERDLENMMELRGRLDINRVLDAARKILRARRVVVVGIDYAAALAWYLDYHLTVFGIHSEAPVGTSGNLQHRGRTLTSHDVLIAISFGRCLKETVNAARDARARGITTIGITDSDFSPLARHCDTHLLAQVANSSLAASYTTAIALLNCLLVAISFGRCLKETVNAARDAHARGIATIGITDSDFSPLARHCDTNLLVRVATPSLAASYTTAVALLNCLLVACAHIAPERSLEMLRRIEKDRHESERWSE